MQQQSFHSDLFTVSVDIETCLVAEMSSDSDTAQAIKRHGVIMNHSRTKDLLALKLKAKRHSSQHSGIAPGSVRGSWPLPSAELSS